MKRTVCIVLGALVLMAGTLNAQAKIGWVNLAAIMEKLPEAQDAQRYGRREDRGHLRR